MSTDRSGAKRSSKFKDTALDHVLLHGGALTHQQVVAVARANLPVKVSKVGRQRAEAAHVAVLKAAQRRPVYAQSTGVGANKDYLVSVSEAADHGLRLVRSHAAGDGPLVGPEIARAMMVVRLNQLAHGGSGVRPELLDALEYALNNGLVPPITKYGAIGTGDLTALATTALCMMGERPWQGGTMLAQTFDRTDAMAFMSSSAATLGEAALVCHDLLQDLRAGLQVAALSFAALGGNIEALHEKVQLAHPHPGQRAAAETLQLLLGPVRAQHARRIQDSYCLRALPQVHGAALDALEYLERILTIEMNGSPENPLVDPDSSDVFHNGNFHTIYVGLALDGVRLAIYNTAALSAARISALMDPGLTTLRPFLASGPEASSGLLITEYIAQSALAELRHLAMPDSVGGAVVSRGTEEHASFVTQSVWHTASFAAAYETVLACELVAAVRALRQQEVPMEGPLHDVYAAALLRNPSIDDRSIERDLALARECLKNL